VVVGGVANVLGGVFRTVGRVDGTVIITVVVVAGITVVVVRTGVFSTLRTSIFPGWLVLKVVDCGNTELLSLSSSLNSTLGDTVGGGENIIGL
jgi:hypothetical protein